MQNFQVKEIMKNEVEKIDNQQGNGVLPCVSTRICSYCSGVEFETMETQYNDVDGNYDECTITYCIKCRMTHSIEL